MTKDECLNDMRDLRDKLSQDSRMDGVSLERRCKVVKDKLEKETPEDAADIVAELRAAADLLDVPTMKALKFRKVKESPDIEIEIGEHKMGVEVRRYRPKVGAKRNEQVTEEKLFAAPKEGRLVPYGDPQRIEQEIVEMIAEKSEKCKAAKADYPWIFLYILSDSRHYVEDMEIKSAWGRALNEVSPLTFDGLLFRRGNRSGLLLNHAKRPPDEVIHSLYQRYTQDRVY